jgi:hypothetical protein
VGTIIEQGGACGQGTRLAGQRVNLEFVSANPTVSTGAGAGGLLGGLGGQLAPMVTVSLEAALATLALLVVPAQSPAA